MKLGYHKLNTKEGFLLDKLPPNVSSELKPIVEKIKNNFPKSTPINHTLAGHIDKEYSIKIPLLSTQYIKNLIGTYHSHNPQYLNSLTSPILEYNGDAWINFQKKYEYNPMHNHSGVFSYVIWYQIPFYREDEIKQGAGKKEDVENFNSCFQFNYIDNNNTIESTTIPIDKTWEKVIAIFPSTLNHQVFPFYTSDDYRITISGNIHLKKLINKRGTS